MSIRNYFILMLPLMYTVTVFSAEGTKEWTQFKETHDLFLCIKNTFKNEDRWVKFPLAELPDDSLQITWILREDFLPKERKIDLERMQQQHQCNVYEQRVGSVEEKFRMLTVGMFEPREQNYSFVMQDYYSCIFAFVVPNEKNQRVDLLAQAKQYFIDLKQHISEWMSRLKEKA